MKKKILLVNSAQSVLESEKGLLSRDYFEIFTAANGVEALDVHRRESVDAIVMNLNMHNMSGEELCREVRRDPKLRKTAILLAVAAGNETEAERCRMAGADGYIKEPFDKDELSEKLAKLLNISIRQAIRILVKVRMEGVVDNTFFIANTVDVSATGLLFECDRPMKIGDKIETSFFLPVSSGYRRIVARSEVMRVAGAGGSAGRYGVRFTGYKEGGAELITEFVAAKTGKK